MGRLLDAVARATRAPEPPEEEAHQPRGAEMTAAQAAIILVGGPALALVLLWMIGPVQALSCAR